MGMEADLVAFGRFSPELAGFLDYPLAFYANVQRGTLVHATIIRCDTSSQSRELADLLLIDPWNFEQHHMVAEHFTDEMIYALNKWSTEELGQPVYNALKYLKHNYFTFFYLPNG